MRIFILFLFLLCASCTKPLGDENPLEQPSSEAPGEFAIASIQRVELQLLVAWTSSKGAKSYELNYGTTAGTYTETITAAKSPLVIQGLTPGTTYYFRMKAINSLGTTLSTAEKSYPFLGAPGEFTILTAIPGNGKVTLAWDLSPEASSYAVMSGPSADNITTTVAAKALPPFEVTSLTNGTTYHFKVVATNPIGSRDSSNTMSATPTPPPSVPLNLTTGPTSNSCTLTWEPPTTGVAPILYTVRRWTGPASNVVVCDKTPAPTCADTGRPPGMAEYTVEAENFGGTGPQTSRASCAIGLPGDFQLLSATPADTKVTLTWQPSANATSYTVKYGTSSDNISTVASTTASSPYIVNSLLNMVPYYFSVTAVNAVASKSATNTLTATPNIPPSAPQNPKVSIPEQGKCTLTWDTPASGAPPLTYTVRRVVNASVNVVICENISTRTCSEPGLSSSTYNYTIEAVNTTGTSPVAGPIACALGAPGTVTLNNATAGNTTAAFSWSGGSGANSFTVRYGTTNPPNQFTIPNATSPYTITGLSNGVLYYYTVDAINAYTTTTPTAKSVTPVSNKPTLTWLGVLSTTAVTTESTLQRKFRIADPDPEDTVDCASSLSASSSDPSIIPNENITFGGSGTQCSVSITPAAGTSGNATVTISVTDGHAPLTVPLKVYRLPSPQRIYSWKRYGSYNGPAIRIRRASDSAEADIYFDSNGVINKLDFDTFRNGTNPFLVKWYDQSGNNQHATQTTLSKQPYLTLTGTGAYLLIVNADGVDDTLTVPNFPIAANTTTYLNFKQTQRTNVSDIFSYGDRTLGSYSGFHLTKSSGNTGAWVASSAASINTMENTNGVNSDATERGLALVMGSAPLKRDFISATTSTINRYPGSPTQYLAPAAGTPLYVFSGGTTGGTSPILGAAKEILIFDQELVNEQISALATQNN
ncbi:fibronectin type III domain-containing protein [Bdellovibrio sp.]|uniref:fibronectin type III domain-containing protein n=1 Tax=Bdellovibrio sp. TaxID=28201 RepID=UPI00322155BE